MVQNFVKGYYQNQVPSPQLGPLLIEGVPAFVVELEPGAVIVVTIDAAYVVAVDWLGLM